MPRARRSAPPRPKRDTVAFGEPDEQRRRASPEIEAALASTDDTGEADTLAPTRREPVRVDPDEPPYETRPRASRGDPVPLLTNDELARIFFEIGDMLELKGELPFKIGAYRRAADSIAHATADVAQGYRSGRPPRLTGVGKAIDDKLAELADTGRLRFYERLRQEVPPSLVDLLVIPGVGARTAREIHQALGISSMEELETAARAGGLRSVPGISAKGEQRILEGLEQLRTRPRTRLRLGQAAEVVERVEASLRMMSGVVDVIPAGSFRRRRETVGDLDLLVETDQPGPVIEAFTGLAAVEHVGEPETGPPVRGGRAAGHRATVQLLRGPQVDLMTMPTGKAGTYLVHFTGSAEHNVRLRERARDLGWSLSEHGFLELDPGGEPVPGAEAGRRTFATEAEVYQFLGLPLIPPELREDRGEIEAAQAGTLPTLVELADLQGDCHTHSTWSDGHVSLERMAETGRARGYAFQVQTDHSTSLTIANGLTPERVEQQRRVIGELNERFAREEAAGTLPPGAHPSGFRLLHGCEMEIRLDGRLDYDDALLARFDVVVASLHVGRRQPRKQLMDRYMVALHNPHVDIIAHPSGRKIGIRDDLDLDWELFYRTAAETGTLLEINGSDERMDLDDRRIHAALEAGCMFVIDSDAHYLDEFDNVRWGIGLARRGWLEARHVANTRSRDAFLQLIAEKPHRTG